MASEISGIHHSLALAESIAQPRSHQATRAASSTKCSTSTRQRNNVRDTSVPARATPKTILDGRPSHSCPRTNCPPPSAGTVARGSESRSCATAAICARKISTSFWNSCTIVPDGTSARGTLPSAVEEDGGEEEEEAEETVCSVWFVCSACSGACCFAGALILFEMLAARSDADSALRRSWIALSTDSAGRVSAWGAVFGGSSSDDAWLVLSCGRRTGAVSCDDVWLVSFFGRRTGAVSGGGSCDDAWLVSLVGICTPRSVLSMVSRITSCRGESGSGVSMLLWLRLRAPSEGSSTWNATDSLPLTSLMLLSSFLSSHPVVVSLCGPVPLIGADENLATCTRLKRPLFLEVYRFIFATSSRRLSGSSPPLPGFKPIAVTCGRDRIVLSGSGCTNAW
mmetsp:Transcript_19971/g.47562  ORF Transcript_19971/g.47562 Transcript_19971/m.47562 type:complete len:396 (-) Transcript_19971:257-1444(-)